MERAGAEVETANSGAESLKKVSAAQDEDHPFDLVLMDVQMPEMDGFEATKKLRSDGFEGPIVALTASVIRGDYQECVDAGCTDHLAKPIDPVALIDTVVRYTGSKS